MAARQPPGHPRLPDPAYGTQSPGFDREPFVAPGPPSSASHGLYYDESDMDHGAFERRDTFQSEGSAHNLVEDHRHDPRYYNDQQQYDPYGKHFVICFFTAAHLCYSPASRHRHRV